MKRICSIRHSKVAQASCLRWHRLEAGIIMGFRNSLMRLPCPAGRVLAVLLLATAASAFAADPADPLAWPGKPPIIPVADSAPATPAPTTVDPKLLEALHATDYAQREAAVASLVQLGPVALPALQELVKSADGDTAWWLQAAIQQIEPAGRKQTQVANLEPADILKLLATPGTEAAAVLDQLRALPPRASDWLVDAHLRLDVGMEYLYSLRPAQVLPRAARLLAVQDEPFYQMLLLRLMRSCLERTLVTCTDADELPPEVVRRYLGAHPELTAAVKPFLGNPLPPLRREALRFMALARAPLDETVVTVLLKDPDPEVNRESRLLAYLFLPADKVPVNAEVAAWIAECMTALIQDQDRLARLGALYALQELRFTCPADLDRAWQAAPPGWVKDTLAWILSSTATGRLGLLRAKVNTFRDQPPTSLASLISLQRQDLAQRDDQRFQGVLAGPEVALFWRNLVNAGTGLSRSMVKRYWTDRDWVDRVLTPNAIKAEEIAGELRLSRPEQFKGVTEFAPWYDACARSALSSHLWVADGAVRGLLCSDLAGARALVRLCGAAVAKELADGGSSLDFPRDLLLLHHNVGYLPAGEVPAPVLELWRTRGLDRRRITQQPNGQPRYAGQRHELPMALWDYACQRFTYENQGLIPFLRDSLTVRQMPLLLALLEMNPQLHQAIVWVDPWDAAPVLRQRIESRMQGMTNEVKIELLSSFAEGYFLDGMPAAECLMKLAPSMAETGVRALIGRSPGTFAGRVSGKAQPSPLAAGALREMLEHIRSGRVPDGNSGRPGGTRKIIEEGLTRMGLPVEPATVSAASVPSTRK